jgi:hypothetical protein
MCSFITQRAAPDLDRLETGPTMLMMAIRFNSKTACRPSRHGTRHSSDESLTLLQDVRIRYLVLRRDASKGTVSTNESRNSRDRLRRIR